MDCVRSCEEWSGVWSIPLLDVLVMEVIHQNFTVVVAGSIPTIGEFHAVGPGACKKALFACLATNVN